MLNRQRHTRPPPLSTDSPMQPGRMRIPAVSGSTAASQAEQETATSTTVFVSPGRQQFHPSAAKAWCQANTTGTIVGSYNMTSVTDVGTGEITFTIATDFSNANWCPVLSHSRSGTVTFDTQTNSLAAGSFTAECWDFTVNRADPTLWFFAGFGDQ